jgi:hypothetical protein
MTTETDRIVAAIDETRRTEHWRDNDCRPDAKAFRSRGRVPPEIVRSQTRLRTAAWRNTMDRRKAPDSREIAMALVHALITSKLSEITRSDRDLIARMLMDLHARGYDVKEAKATLRRMRNRYVGHGDRQGEPTESCGAPLKFAGEADEDMPF